MSQCKQRKRVGTWEEDERTLQQRAAARRAMMAPMQTPPEFWVPIPPEREPDLGPYSPASLAMSAKIRAHAYMQRTRRRLSADEYYIANANQSPEE